MRELRRRMSMRGLADERPSCCRLCAAEPSAACRDAFNARRAPSVACDVSVLRLCGAFILRCASVLRRAPVSRRTAALWCAPLLRCASPSFQPPAPMRSPDSPRAARTRRAALAALPFVHIRRMQEEAADLLDRLLFKSGSSGESHHLACRALPASSLRHLSARRDLDQAFAPALAPACAAAVAVAPLAPAAPLSSLSSTVKPASSSALRSLR